VATELGVPDAAIRKALAEFRGVGRRFQRYGEISLAPNAGRQAASPWWTTTGITPSRCGRRSMRARRFSGPAHRARLPAPPLHATRDLFEDFVKALSGADALLLAEVIRQAKRLSSPPTGARSPRAIRDAGKTEPVFVAKISDMPDPSASLCAPVTSSSPWAQARSGSVPAALAKAGRMKMTEPIGRDPPLSCAHIALNERCRSTSAGAPVGSRHEPMSSDRADLTAFLRPSPARPL